MDYVSKILEMYCSDGTGQVGISRRRREDGSDDAWQSFSESFTRRNYRRLHIWCYLPDCVRGQQQQPEEPQQLKLHDHRSRYFVLSNA